MLSDEITLFNFVSEVADVKLNKIGLFPDEIEIFLISSADL